MFYLRRVVGASMVPALRPGKIVLFVRKRSYKKGNIVLAEVEGRQVVKRVVMQLGGKLWLQGDNTTQSTDSRSYGAVDVSAIKGKLFIAG